MEGVTAKIVLVANADEPEHAQISPKRSPE
jgi:hypothetical protein